MDGKLRSWPDFRLISALPAVVLAVLGFALIVAGLGIFKRSDTSPEPWRPAANLVTNGLYSKTRNPMYGGLLMVYAALALLFESAVAGILIAPLFAIFNWVLIRREETYLTRHFGQAYENYRQSVRRWI
jgi:protein-S-isoprenylcysteine O-methyltransferase Ste14